jgi:hypothetical protein
MHSFSAERVARRYIEGMEHSSPEELRQYLHDHPDADPSNHVVVKKDEKAKKPEDAGGGKEKSRPDDTAPPKAKAKPEEESTGEKPEGEGEEKAEGKKPSLKERLKALPSKAKAFMQGAEKSAKSFIEDPAFRRQAMQHAADAIAKSPERVVKDVIKGIKHEAKEWKEAAGGIKAAMTGKEVSKEQKKAMKTVAIDLAITVAVVALTGGLAGGATGLVQESAKSFISGVAKKVALNAVSDGLGNLTTLQELGHGAHGLAELAEHFITASEDGEANEDEVFATWVTGLVVKELKKGGSDDDVMEALEALGGDKEASMSRRVVARFQAA